VGKLHNMAFGVCVRIRKESSGTLEAAEIRDRAGQTGAKAREFYCTMFKRV